MKVFNIISLQYILIYLIIINVITMFIYWLDKKLAIKQKRRISEKTLIYFALFGGSIGAILGMYIFRHKTKKSRFAVGLPVLLFFQIAIIIVLCYNGYVI